MRINQLNGVTGRCSVRLEVDGVYSYLDSLVDVT